MSRRAGRTTGLFEALSALAVALASCTPAIDRTGQVRCGAGGECPTGFQCAAGRCCPTDDFQRCAAAFDASSDATDVAVDTTLPDAPDATDAPVVDTPVADTPVTDTPGGDTMDGAPLDVVDAAADVRTDAPADVPTFCGADAGVLDCGAGRECRDGYCCNVTDGMQCPPGAIGAPCTRGGDCTRVPGAASVCVTSSDADPAAEYPGGYCSSVCNPAMRPDPCGPLGVCVPYSVAGSCARYCNAADEGRPCRGSEPYICRLVDIGGGARAHLCMPDCTAGADCDGPGACYRRRHFCRPACGGDAGACPFFTECSASDGVCLPYCTLGCPVGLSCGGMPALCR